MGIRSQKMKKKSQKIKAEITDNLNEQITDDLELNHKQSEVKTVH